MAGPEPLDGKIFAITGASRGMGLRFAHALAASGAQVVLLARPSTALTQASAELPDALALPCDIGDPIQVREAFAAIGARFGRLNGLINNAAACLAHPIDGVANDDVDLQIATNLAGPIYCIQEAIPLMRLASGGDIINISSESVRGHYPQLSVYAATKAGLESLSESLRKELRPEGIRVTVLRSGSVAGGSLSSHWKPEQKAIFQEALATDPEISGRASVSPDTMASMLVQMLRLPREAALDRVELRPF